ncbi:hypothetical protein [Siansivirga zeaxanthinifaciens]|uniref:Uncharacterized protein n=1 Tax=Siansivirga zeaxanthinifaciens CC-SAMT-1 TaxID=1454006 RepID=A0A0C5WD63_9FLAO|nr:hypothetical protein [Siansivirga zeaxanthinifaciens]AJR05023.1 hypothetical protein AW14_14700 [Siansivirga zeaxanthinifaciens CC-SAMT-1]
MKQKLQNKLSQLKVISVLIKFLKQKDRKSKLRKRVLSQGESYSEIARNMILSIKDNGDLYKNLISKIELNTIPTEKLLIAKLLLEKINQYKRDYKKLKNLQVQVDAFLDNA